MPNSGVIDYDLPLFAISRVYKHIHSAYVGYSKYANYVYVDIFEDFYFLSLRFPVLALNALTSCFPSHGIGILHASFFSSYELFYPLRDTPLAVIRQLTLGGSAEDQQDKTHEYDSSDLLYIVIPIPMYTVYFLYLQLFRK